MNFRTLGLGLSVGLVALAAAPVFGQIHPNRLHLMADAPAPPTPEQIIVSDIQAPLRAPAPLPPQIIHHSVPMMTPPTHVFVPHNGMAMRVQAIEEGAVMSHPMPPTIVAAHGPYDARPAATPASHPACAAPCVCPSPGHPIHMTAPHAVYPTTAPAAYPAIYAAPASSYPAPAASKVELLRCALNQLEMAGADDLAKQVKTEIAAEEKREFIEELSRKESELKVLQSEIQSLREKIGEDAPQVMLKLQVLDLDLAKARALGFDCKQALASHNHHGHNHPENCDKNGQCQGISPCVVEANCELLGLLNSMKSEGLVKVIDERSVVAVSGQPAQFCSCAEPADAAGEECPCGDRPHLGIKFDVLATVKSEDCVRAEVYLKIGEGIEAPQYTTGLESLPIVGGVASRVLLAIDRMNDEPMPPAIRLTQFNTGFEAKPGQTYLTGLVRKSSSAKEHCVKEHCVKEHCVKEHCVKEHCVKEHCVKEHCVKEHCVKEHCVKEHCVKEHCVKEHCVKEHCVKEHCAKACCESKCASNNPDCKETCCECKAEKQEGVLRMVLITPEVIGAETKPAAKCSCTDCSAVKYDVSSTSALKLNMMREPFLTDVDAALDFSGIVGVAFSGVQPQFLGEYHRERQLNDVEAQKFERMRVKILGGKSDPSEWRSSGGSVNSGIEGHSSQATPKSPTLPSALFGFSIGLSR